MPANVLLLVFDTARADAFEPYGAPAGATPTVSQLASSGQAVDHVFSTACWTLPSHASMFTGLLPRALGLTQAPGGTPHGARPVLEAQQGRLLPEVLRRAGYETRAASANLWVSPYAGFATGFDKFEYVSGDNRVARLERNELRGRLGWAMEGFTARTDDGAGAVEELLRSWLREPADRPFFWFVNLVEAHSPYLPPRPYNDLRALDRIRAASEARRHLSMMSIWQTCLAEFDVPDGALERMRHLYRRSVLLLDDWLARVLDALDQSGVLEETLVIVTSDHGENFGEGGLLAHAFSLDDRLIRVPLVVNRPGFVEGDAARSLAQLPELLADYLGIDDHPWHESGLPGGCAAAQFDFVEPDDPRVQMGVDMWGLDDSGRAMLTTPLTSVTDGELKLMLRGGVEELYDLGSDPLEQHPLPPDGHRERNRITRLRAGLAADAVRARSDAVAAPSSEMEDIDEIEQRMKLLGYL